MIENNFFYTEKIRAVMPVEIKIRVFRNLFETKFFDKDGQPIYVLEKRESMNRRYENNEKYETFTDDLYIELLSVDDEKQAENFINNHPYYCISFPDDSGSEYTANVINKRDYFQLMLENINDFRAINAIFNEVYLMMKEPDNSTARDSAIQLFMSDSTLELSSGTQYGLTMCHGSGSLSSRQKPMLDDAIYRLIRYIELRTKTIKMTAQFKPLVEFCCPSLLSALYQKMLIAAINREEYRKCAKKTCPNYFKVESRSTRKFCDKHMEPRRRKQNNAIEKRRKIEDEERLAREAEERKEREEFLREEELKTSSKKWIIT